MKKEKIEKYAKELNKDMVEYYLNAFCQFNQSYKNNNKLSWAVACPLAMQSFVLSRPGWKKIAESEESLIFNDKYTLDINALYVESPGKLMLSTAIAVAKAELIDDIIKNGDALENSIANITNCVNNQDWIIPFIRKKS